MNRSLALLTLLALGTLARAAGTLVYGAPGEPVTLDAGNASDNPSLQVQTQLYDRLVNFKPGTAVPAPGLATSWTSNQGATVWTFKLRRDVKFTDGAPFNADAVLFNVNRWWDARDPNRGAGKTFEIWSDLLGGFKGDSNSVLKSLTKLDDFTVRFTLAKPFSAFPDVLGTDYFGIASPRAVRAQGARYGTPASTPVGTGPFVFRSWKTGDRIILAPNKSYWGQKGDLDAFVVRFLKNPSARLNELRAGTIDFTSSLNPDDAKSIKRDPKLRLVLPPAFNVGLLNLNTRNSYLKNDRVRKAISLAVNRPAIVEAFWGDLGSSDNSLLPLALDWANSKNVPQNAAYDPQAAKKLLAEAGYPNGFTLDLWYMPISRSYYPTPEPVAEAIAADLAAVGIKTKLRTEDWAAYLKDRASGKFDMFLYGWSGDYGDPDNFYSAFYGNGGSDDTGYNPASIQRLLEQGRAEGARSKKAGVYARLHELTFGANVRLPIVHGVAPAAARTYVKNWITGPLGVLENVNLIRLEGKQ